MTINIQLPKKQSLRPQIAVFGVGGAGCNAVNNMINSRLEGVDFIVANTDAQTLENSLTEKRIQLGKDITQGLGAGSYPEVGKAAAEESLDEIVDYLQGCNMVFVTAGMGGGTGTGAAPVIARLAREMGILTVSVVTKPFHFEGAHRMKVGELGLQELQKFVDTLIVIPNQNLFRIADKNTTFADAFKMADDVLHNGVRSVTDLMVVPGLINLDFADVRSIMSGMGRAMMGTGEAEGDKRALEAAEAAISNPLLDNTSMQGAKGVLINITGGSDMTLFEVDEAANRIREETDQEANIIFGSTFNQDLQGKIRVSVVATGIDGSAEQKPVKSASFFMQTKETRPQPSISQRFSFSAQEVNEEEAEYQSIQVKEEITVSEDELRISASTEETFIAPEPVEPDFSSLNQRTEANFREEEEVLAATLPKMEAEVERRPIAATRSSFSFFGNKAAKAASSTAEIASKPQFEAPGIKTQVKEKDFSPRQDSFDIPAFLRRKNNQ